MLRGFSIKNYKAFEDAAIEIRPITVLLGANSIGKSSLLQFLLMLQQTALASENYKAALKLYGGYLSLGEAKNIFRKQELNAPVQFRLDFRDNRLIRRLTSDIMLSSLTELFEYVRFSDHLALEKPTSRFRLAFNELFHSVRQNPFDNEFLNNIDSTIDRVALTAKDLRKNTLSDDSLYFQRFNPTFLYLDSTKDEIRKSFDFLRSLHELVDGKSPTFSVEYSVISVDGVLRISKFRLLIDQQPVVDLDFSVPSKQKFSFKSPLVDSSVRPAKLHEALQTYIYQPKTIYSFVEINRPEAKMPREFGFLAETIARVISVVLSSVDDYFEERNISHVSPLRAHPRRYYFLDKAKINVYLDTLDGDSMAEIIKENEGIKQQVNGWLKKFGLDVKVNPIKDILHRLVVNQNDVELDITDVGFGISQVLPVVIQGFLSSDDSITLIEQPEIHLHPKMQADLADLFIDIVRTRENKRFRYKKSLVVETHSEYLLKRLRRRISEKKIEPENVAIYLVSKTTENNRDESKIQRLDIESTGNFEYPVEFYGGELLKDDLEFLKNQL